MKEKYEWHPDTYRNNSDFQYEEAMALINSYQFNGNEKILDIGCGDGRITNYLATLVPKGHVLGIDSSASMIRHAQEKHKQENLNFKEMPAEEIGFQEEFDVIFSSFCLHWVKDKQNVFNRIHNGLKPQGVFLCVAVVRNEILAQARRELLHSSLWKQYFCEYKDPSESTAINNYTPFAEMAHLQINVHNLKKRVVEFQTREKMSNFIRNLTLCLSRLPSTEQKDSFMKKYLDRYFQLYKNSDKIDFRINFDVIELKAQKS